MLAMNTYSKVYIGEAEARMKAQLSAYAKLEDAARAGETAAAPALEAFEPLFFNHLLLALEATFVHRTRALEGKDGNALNEVRLLCNSLLHHKGILRPDRTNRYLPEESVLNFDLGDAIRLDLAGFRKLTKAFFEEIRARYGEQG